MSFYFIVAVTTYLSRVSASLYALITNHPINTISPMKRTQLRNLDQEKIRCMTNMAVKSRLDCHAWNLKS
jgi:hypothetical protein